MHVEKPLTAEPSCKDEARVGQQGTLGAIWAEIGSRPPGVRDDRHDSAWLFGAVCSKRGVGAALVMPWVSSEAMTLHLRAIGAAVSPGAHAVLVCDGAGWHRTGGRLVVADNVTLLPLPGYSPELNPIENVWAYLRGKQQAELERHADTPWSWTLWSLKLDVAKGRSGPSTFRAIFSKLAGRMPLMICNKRTGIDAPLKAIA